MTRRRWIAGVAIIAVLAVYAAIPTHEVWLGVPPALRGAVVYAEGRQVAVIEQPDLTLIRLWRPAREIRVEKPGFEPVVLALKSRGKSYLTVEAAALRRTASVAGAVGQPK